MSRQYPIADARASLGRIVEQAEAGLTVELTRRGQLVAVVLSPQTYDRLRSRRGHFAEAYQRFRERFPLSEVGLDATDLAMKREETSGRRVVL